MALNRTLPNTILFRHDVLMRKIAFDVVSIRLSYLKWSFYAFPVNPRSYLRVVSRARSVISSRRNIITVSFYIAADRLASGQYTYVYIYVYTYALIYTYMCV